MDQSSMEPSGTFSLANARLCCTQYDSVDQSRKRMLESLVQQLNTAQIERQELALEIEDQKSSRSRYQQDCRTLQHTLETLRRKLDRDPFIVALVDGDGAKFRDCLLRNEDSGGAEAARLLRQEIRQYIDEISPNSIEKDIPIVVKIWAHVDGLANILYKDGVIQGREQMIRFAETFSRSRAEFDFVNVGRGKENADSKMRKMLNFYLKIPQCKKIFFCGCHDTGYIHELEEKRGEEESQGRIILLETTPAEPQFRRLGFPITRFDTVFRSEPMSNEHKRNFGLVTTQVHELASHLRAASADIQRSDLVSPASQPVPRTLRSDNHSDIHRPHNAEMGSNAARLWMSANGGVSVTYAAAGGDTPYHNVDVAPSNSTQERHILCNANGNRVDPGIKPPGRDNPAQKTYRMKADHIYPKAFCNDHYLVGHCSRGNNCEKEHKERLSSEEIAIHRFRARTNPCFGGPTCFNFECCFSHHCPSGIRCTRGENCQFFNTEHGDLHYKDSEALRPVSKWIQGRSYPVKLNGEESPEARLQ